MGGGLGLRGKHGTAYLIRVNPQLLSPVTGDVRARSLTARLAFAPTLEAREAPVAAPALLGRRYGWARVRSARTSVSEDLTTPDDGAVPALVPAGCSTFALAASLWTCVRGVLSPLAALMRER